MSSFQSVKNIQYLRPAVDIRQRYPTCHISIERYDNILI